MTTGTRWPEARARRGLIASPHALAASAGAVTHAGEGCSPSSGQRRTTLAAAALFDPSAPDEVRRTLWPIHQAIQIDDGGLAFAGASDPRADGAALGW